MDLTIDHFATVGLNHHICQDYSMACSENNLKRIILCDGCSSSRDTDYGARIWARAANNYLFYRIEPRLEDLDSSKIPDIVEETKGCVESVINILGLPKDEAADSTLLFAFQLGDIVKAFIFGDGIFFAMSGDQLEIFQLEFSHNAPFYPSYMLDGKRLAGYLDFSKEAKLKRTHYETGSEAINTTFEPVVFETMDITMGSYFAAGDFTLVGLATDGICQIKEKGTANFLHIKKVLRDLLAFKGIEGEFLKRRVSRALTQYSKEGYFPTDDLSIAVMINKERWYVENHSSS